MTNTEMREKLVEIFSSIPDCIVGCEGCEYDRANRCLSFKMADHLIANGVTLKPPKKEKPPTSLSGKCGGCKHGEPCFYGNSPYYVRCINEEHKNSSKHQRYPSMAIRQRTTRACSKYEPREETENA